MFYYFLLAYVAVLLIVSFKSFNSIQTISDYLVAGKKGTIFGITGSLLATILGGSAIVGTVDAGYRMGWAVAWFMLCAAIGLFLLVPFVKKVFDQGKYTLPDILATTLGPNAKWLSSIIIPIAWLGIVAAQIIATANILESFTSIKYEIGVVSSATFFLLYTFLGGQVSILKTDKIQSIFILLGLFVVAYFITTKEHSFSLKPIAHSFPFNANFSVFDLVILFFTYALTFTIGPDIFSRVLSSKDVKTAKISIIITASILIPIAFLIAYISLYGVQLFPEKMSGSLIVNVSKEMLPEWAAIIMAIALLSAVLSSADTTLLSASIILGNVFQRGKYNEKSLIVTRVLLIIITFLSVLIALNFQSVITVLLIGLAVFSGAFTVPILFSFVGVRMNESAINWAIIIGGSFALVGKVIYLQGHSFIGNLFILLAFLLSGLVLLIKKKPL